MIFMILQYLRADFSSVSTPLPFPSSGKGCQRTPAAEITQPAGSLYGVRRDWEGFGIFQIVNCSISAGAPPGMALWRCWYALWVTHRPRGVRVRKPSCIR